MTPSDELLARYLSGECSAEDREWVGRWVSGDPARGRMLEEMSDFWSAPSQAPEQWDTSGMRARLRAQIRPARPQLMPQWSASKERSPMRWALAAVLVLAVGVSLWQVQRRPAPVQTAEVAKPDSSRFSTRRGQRAVITLTDGSRVVLGVGSRLAVAPEFGKGARVVSLEGEAYFEVAPDSGAPFLVRTATSVTQVVGTAFAVRQYAQDATASIAVERGRVAIGRHVSSAMLGPGDVGQVRADGSTRVRHDPLAMRALTSWRDGWFTLINTPLGDAAQALSRWYDLEVRIAAPELRGRVVDVRFDDVAPDAVLRAIADAVDARVVWKGRTVTFYPR
jgi:ferric-dicitrate binding protein FerR (iron transport regulator)